MGIAGIAGVEGEVSRADVIRAARKRFLRGDGIDVVGLADDLGIARATVYRWYGGRQRILSEVLWSLSEATLDRALAAGRRSGPQAVADALVRLMSDVATNPAMRRLLDREPQLALTTLTSQDGVVQSRLVARIAQLVEDECPQAAGDGMALDDLAYAITRVGEAFCYADVIAGRDVEVERARPLILRLLGER